MPGDAEVPLAWMPPGSSVSPLPSEEIFPPQTIPLRFNHKKHVKVLSLSCKVCHAAAYTSTQAGDRLLPLPAETCDNCHDVDHSDPAHVRAGKEATGQCAFCHVGAAAGEVAARWRRVILPRRTSAFPTPSTSRCRQHPVRSVPRPGRRARAGHARPAPPDGGLLGLPRHERRRPGRRQGSLHHLPPLPAGRAGPDRVRGGLADPAAVAPRRRARRRLDRAPQGGGRGRQRLLRELPHLDRVHRLPRRQRAPAQGAPQRLALDAPPGGAHRQPPLLELPRGADVLRRLATAASGSRGTLRAATVRPAAASTPRRPSGPPHPGGPTTTPGRRCCAT